MTFAPVHYVPALKLKTGEKDALATLALAVKTQLTPLLQVVEKVEAKPTEKHIATAFKKLQPAVSGLNRFFIDPIEIAPLGAAAAADVFAQCGPLGVPFTPVTGLSRRRELTEVAMAAVGRTGLAVRLTREDFEGGALPGLSAFLRDHAISVATTDLIVDLGPVHDMIADGIAALAEAFVADVAHLPQWQSFTLLASAFPKSMQHVDRDSHAFAERAEWVAWRTDLRSGRLPRSPTFGDWAIQHPAGVEHFDPRKMQASAAIRYALESRWLLIKGRGTKTVPPGRQMPRLAEQLITGAQRRFFAGGTHCVGCKLIVDAANGAPKLGSLTKWRQIGTAHHITATVEALQKLPSP